MKKAANPSWADIKKQLSGFERAELVALVQDLYAVSKENQAFLHARFCLGDDLLKPYKRTVDRWICPDLSKGQDVSVSKAKKAIADHKKAVGRPDALSELMVFYCERAAAFCANLSFEDDSFFIALVRMYAQALRLSAGLSQNERQRFMVRLGEVCEVCKTLGYGVSDEMEVLLSEYSADEV